MNKPPTAHKISPIWIILAALVSIPLMWIASAVAMTPYLFNVYRTIDSQIPHIVTEGKFENGIYTAPKQNFTCAFPWQSVAGESLTDEMNESSGSVKYNNDFGVYITIQYLHEQNNTSWPQGRDERAEFLEGMYNTVTVPGLESDFYDVAVVHSEHRLVLHPEFFAVSKFNTEQDEMSGVMRGDLLFVQNRYFYSITFASYEWTPGYAGITRNQWIDKIDKALQDFYSNCQFK